MESSLAKDAIDVLEKGRPRRYQFFHRLHGGDGSIHEVNYGEALKRWKKNLDELERYIKRVRDGYE